MNINQIQNKASKLAPVELIARNQRRLKLKLRRKAIKRRLTRYGLVAAYVAILGGVAGFVLYSPQTDSNFNNQVSLLDNSNNTLSPLDQLSSASVAANVAQIGQFSERAAVQNLADTVIAELSIVQSADSLVAKPQVVSAALKSRLDIQKYVAQSGDTVSSLAVKFGVSSDSIKWSNGISYDTLNAGQTLVIPPVNGFTYTVAAGDTPDSLAVKYKTTAQQITVFNDAEVSGLKAGELIVIPNGQKTVARTYAVSSFAYNGYDYGYCTYWVAKRRIEVGSPVPINLGNASAWYSNARRFSMSVGRGEPRKYAAAVTSTRGEGHVAFVEEVYSDGSILLSEMNKGFNWNVVSRRVASAQEASGFLYVY